VVRGFLSFVVDLLVHGSCLSCGRELRPFDSGTACGFGPDWPSWANEFFSVEFGFEVLRGIRTPATVLCVSCWLSLEPARSMGFVPVGRREGQGVPLVSPFFTNDPLLEAIRFLKFSGGRAAALPLGWWMAGRLREYLAAAEGRFTHDPLLVPVPLHPARERSRGYNQAALLALEVGDRLDLEVEERAVGRARNTKSQTALQAEERGANVAGAFRLLRPERIASRHIVVVDDLVTTGSTAGSCVETISQASPASVSVLSAGRTRG
jgi:ComF family protein